MFVCIIFEPDWRYKMQSFWQRLSMFQQSNGVRKSKRNAVEWFDFWFPFKMVNLQIACVGNTFLGHVGGVSVGSALSHSVPMWTPPTPIFSLANFAGLTALCQHQKVQFCEISISYISQLFHIKGQSRDIFGT